jgi:hypothetical protein
LGDCYVFAGATITLIRLQNRVRAGNHTETPTEHTNGVVHGTLEEGLSSHGP